MNLYVNKVIRLVDIYCYSLLLRLFCRLNKVKIRFFTTLCISYHIMVVLLFGRLKTVYFITLFTPYFLNKTTLVAHRYTLSPPTLLPYYKKIYSGILSGNHIF